MKGLTTLTDGPGSKTLKSFDGGRCANSPPSGWIAVPTSDRLWATERDGDVVLGTGCSRGSRATRAGTVDQWPTSARGSGRVGPRSPRLMSLGAALAAVIAAASSSDLLSRSAAAQVGRRPDDEEDPGVRSLLLAPPAEAPIYLAHESHRSHSSHQSHSSHYSGSGGGAGGGGYAPTPGQAPAVAEPPKPAWPPPPPPPKPGMVSFAAYPGGRIFVDGRLVGRDVTGVMALQPGNYTIRVENRFLGTETQTISVYDGQTGTIEIKW